MASSAPTSPFRQVFQDRLAQFSAELETLFAQAREKGRGELADQLNQAVRRMRAAGGREELGATLVEAAGAVAAGAALFLVEGSSAKGAAVRGAGEDAAESFRSLEIPLDSAAALRGAIETRDPVTAISSAQEVSDRLVQLFGHAGDGRVSIYPVVVREEVPALLYVWGTSQPALLELLAQVSAAVWTGLEPLPPPPAPEPQPAAASGLVQLEPPARKPAATWENLPAGEQRIHLKAQRFARVQASELRLRCAGAVQAGRARGDLYGALREQIDATREAFRRDFYNSCSSMVDYLHLELVRTLAQDHAELLGKDYPGPMV